MHPVIQLLALILLAAALPFAEPAQLACVTLLLVMLFGFFAQSSWRRWFESVMRLRWLLLSLLILYGWFTPGEELWSVAGVNLPSREGVLLGLHRALILVLLIGVVRWVLDGLSHQQVVAALIRILAPLALFGFPVERLAERVGLSLALLPELDVAFKQALPQSAAMKQDRAKSSLKDRLTSAVQPLVDLVLSVEAQAQEPYQPEPMLALGQARLIEWLCLAGLILAYLSLGMLQ